MKLSKSDIRELYGSQLFIIPDEKDAIEEVEKKLSEEALEEKAVASPAPDEVGEPSPEPIFPVKKPLQEGHPVLWKMRPTSTLALVLTQAEFHNKMVTNGLKQLVLDAGINPKEIGFGVLEEGHETWDFSDMPVPVAVVFHPIQVKKNPTSLSSGKVHISYPVSEVVMDPNKQKALLKLFASLI